MGLLALMETTPDIEVVGEAGDGIEAVAKARELQPDVILLDLLMPRMDGIEAISVIKGEMPNAKILVLTCFDDDNMVFPAFKAGALGYLLKDSGMADLLQAIRSVHQGKSVLHPTIAAKVLNALNRPVDLLPPASALTDRELEVLKLVARGLPNQEIAEKLTITQHTVGKHVGNILIKLHLANRTQVTLNALQQGLIHLEDKELTTDFT